MHISSKKLPLGKSLNFVISIPFTALVIISFMIFGIIAFYSSKQSIAILISKLIDQSNNQIMVNLKDYFKTPILVNKINTDAFISGDINTKNLFESPEKYFFKQQYQFPSVNDFYFATTDGSICGVDRLDGKYLLKLTDKLPHRNFFQLDEQGNRGKIVKEDNYNSLDRDWYKNAISKNKPTWSKIYVLKNKNKLGITLSAPAYNKNKELEGVMGVNITLDSISKFLKTTKISTNTTIFIIEKNGDLVATSENEVLFKTINDKPKRVQAFDSTNEIIKNASLYIKQQNYASHGKISTQIMINNINYYLYISKFTDENGLDFIVATVVNENDFMGDMYQKIQVASFIAIGIIILLIIIGQIISKSIAKPIQHLCEEVKNIASGQLGKRINLNYNTKEIGMLIDAFNQMSTQLEESFDNLNDLNKNLETKVSERTQELLKLNQKLEKSQDILLEAHKNIRDSISYGSLIQHTILPDSQQIKNFFEDYFVIWNPKDTVGGDIYLFEPIREHECIFMVIDCTGHGVPGAFVTMLVKAIERQIISNITNNPNMEISPAEILSIFNKTMKHLLNQNSDESLSNAGFDGGILYFNKQTQIVKYAGAETPLFYLQDNDLKVIKGNRSSVGYRQSDIDYEFTNHQLSVSKGMRFYLTTDGFLDQNGGKKEFPFGNKKFKSLIEMHLNHKLENQDQLFLNELKNYQGDLEQNDDITVIAIEI